LWGLAVDGQKGVEAILELIRNELDNVMGIAGCHNVDEITRDMVCHEIEYSKL
jgi:isopentenyl diphosphate isomerase/L-lactate dehydrogenase-like FMN-dependent dehydrogenase